MMEETNVQVWDIIMDSKPEVSNSVLKPINYLKAVREYI